MAVKLTRTERTGVGQLRVVGIDFRAAAAAMEEELVSGAFN